MNSQNNLYERKLIIKDLDRVFKHVNLGQIPSEMVKFAGVEVYMGSMRYKNFKAHGVVCVQCGLEGTFFALERHNNQNTRKWHFNLYAIETDGLEVLMTKDHIHPKAKGGPEKLDNFQPMCSFCNSNKADDVLNQSQLDMINQLKLFNNSMDSLNSARREFRNAINQIKSRCQHVIDKTKSDGTKCKICEESFGWYCPDSEDHSCHYFTEHDEVKDLFYVEMINKSKHYMDKMYSGVDETEDTCLFCGDPEERK